MNERQSKLSRVLMTIENLEQMCFIRSHKLDLKSITYRSVDPNVKLKHGEKKLDESRKNLAVAQLGVINQYLSDFQAIIKQVNQVKEEREARKAEVMSNAVKTTEGEPTIDFSK